MKRKRKREFTVLSQTLFVVVMAFLSVSLVFGGGQKEAEKEAAIDSSSTLTIAVPQEPQDLAAQGIYKEMNAHGLRNVIEPLIMLDPVKEEYVPVLATDWERVDGKTIRMDIRKGVQFHDGTRLDAEAAAFMVTWIWDPENGFTIQEFASPGLITAKAVNDYTIEVSSTEVDPLLEFRMSLTGISSPQQAKNNPAKHYDTPIGTGPYQFEEWKKGQYWSATKNDNWWGLDADDAYGVTKPVHQRIRIVFRPEDSARVAMAETEEAQLVAYPPSQDAEAAEDASGYHAKVKESTSYFYGRLDHSPYGDEALRDPRVREAIFIAIDYEGIADLIGLASVPNGQLGVPGTVGYNPNISQYEYNPERARELLDEARADGVDVDGMELEVSLRNTTPRAGVVAEALHHMLSEVGFDVTANVQEPGVWNPRNRISHWKEKEPNAARLMPHVKTNPSLDYGTIFPSNMMSPDPDDPTGVSRSSVYANEEFDKMLKDALSKFGEERDKAFQKLVKYVYDRHVMIPLAIYNKAYLVDDKYEFNVGPDHRIQVVYLDPVVPVE